MGPDYTKIQPVSVVQWPIPQGLMFSFHLSMLFLIDVLLWRLFFHLNQQRRWQHDETLGILQTQHQFYFKRLFLLELHWCQLFPLFDSNIKYLELCQLSLCMSLTEFIFSLQGKFIPMIYSEHELHLFIGYPKAEVWMSKIFFNFFYMRSMLNNV